MLITQGEIYLNDNDSCDGLIFTNCRLLCNFKINAEDYTSPKIFEIRSFFDGKTEDFKKVFTNSSLVKCEILGTDNNITTNSKGE